MIFSAKKANMPTMVQGYFALSLSEFFPSIKKTSPLMALPSLPIGSHKVRTMQRPLHGVILSVSRTVATLPIWQRLCQSSHQALMPS